MLEVTHEAWLLAPELRVPWKEEGGGGRIGFLFLTSGGPRFVLRTSYSF